MILPLLVLFALPALSQSLEHKIPRYERLMRSAEVALCEGELDKAEKMALKSRRSARRKSSSSRGCLIGPLWSIGPRANLLKAKIAVARGDYDKARETTDRRSFNFSSYHPEIDSLELVMFLNTPVASNFPFEGEFVMVEYDFHGFGLAVARISTLGDTVSFLLDYQRQLFERIVPNEQEFAQILEIWSANSSLFRPTLYGWLETF